MLLGTEPLNLLFDNDLGGGRLAFQTLTIQECNGKHTRPIRFRPRPMGRKERRPTRTRLARRSRAIRDFPSIHRHPMRCKNPQGQFLGAIRARVSSTSSRLSPREREKKKKEKAAESPERTHGATGDGSMCSVYAKGKATRDRERNHRSLTAFSNQPSARQKQTRNRHTHSHNFRIAPTLSQVSSRFCVFLCAPPFCC